MLQYPQLPLQVFVRRSKHHALPVIHARFTEMHWSAVVSSYKQKCGKPTQTGEKFFKEPRPAPPKHTGLRRLATWLAISCCLCDPSRSCRVSALG